MKKINLALTVLALMFVTVFTSCQKDDDVIPGPPTLVFNSGEGYVYENNQVVFGEEFKVGIVAAANAESEANLVRFVAEYEINGETFGIVDSTINVANFNMDFDLVLNANKDVVGSAEWKFKIVDEKEQMAELSLTTDIVSYLVKRENINFGSVNDDLYGSFYDVENDKVMFLAEARENQEKVDFIFYKGSSNLDTYCAPDNKDVEDWTLFAIDTWQTRNATRFMTTTISAEAFDAATTYIEHPTWDDALASDQVTKLEIGDVFMFKTVDGTMGLVKIENLFTKGDKATIDMIIL